MFEQRALAAAPIFRMLADRELVRCASLMRSSMRAAIRLQVGYVIDFLLLTFIHPTTTTKLTTTRRC